STTTIAFLMARKSEGLDVNLSEAINSMDGSQTHRTQVAPINATMYGGTSGDTSSVADSGATNANSAKTTVTNQTSLGRRWRWVTTPTDPEALHGRWDVYCALRPETGSGTDTRYRVCMHWQAANRDPVSEIADEISIDATEPTSSVYTSVFLGTVEFDADAG